MGQNELYEWIANQDCLPHAWLDELVERRENALEAMLREKLQATGDLLDAALREQWLRDRYKMHPLVIA